MCEQICNMLSRMKLWDVILKQPTKYSVSSTHTVSWSCVVFYMCIRILSMRVYECVKRQEIAIYLGNCCWSQSNTMRCWENTCTSKCCWRAGGEGHNINNFKSIQFWESNFVLPLLLLYTYFAQYMQEHNDGHRQWKTINAKQKKINSTA